MSTAPSFESASYQPPTWEAISQAHARIAPRIHRTPLLTPASLDKLAGAGLFFKCENLQKTGSFKIRGAANAILSLSNEQAARGIVTQSSGNHGAAVACAAAWRGVPAYIVMPKNAPKVKVQAIDAYGGKITFCEPKVSSRKETCDRVQAETGAHLVHRYVDRVLLVSEEEIISTARLVWERMKIIIEPSSSVALAPLLKPDVVQSLNLPSRADGQVPKLGVIFSGGNVDLNALPWLS